MLCAIQAVVVQRTKCSRQRNRLRDAEQPFTAAVIRVYDDAGNVIETHERKGDFVEP
jgi:hypothetical protein